MNEQRQHECGSAVLLFLSVNDFIILVTRGNPIDQPDVRSKAQAVDVPDLLAHPLGKLHTAV